MTCAEALDLAPWYPGEWLRPELRLPLVLHTVGCASCRSALVAALAAAESVRAAVAALPGPPDLLRERFLAAVAREPGAPRGTEARRPPRPAAVAAEARERQAARRRRAVAAMCEVLPPVAKLGLEPWRILPPAVRAVGRRRPAGA